ncbi:MAG TPA: copper resistance protein CopC [Candidatus Thermoplasmatota archaeon]|nr:copper resistance protein CopC [Candidatus Thermoplasmatota archaeon]
MSRRAFLGLVATLALAATPLAAAHASVVASDPGAGEAAPRAPDRVVVEFSEALDPSFSSLRVENAEGVRIDKGDLVVDGTRAGVGLPALPKGIYFARWQALSKADGHTTRGSIPFVVGDPTLAAGISEGATTDVDTGGAPESVARAVGFAGLAASIGALAFGWRVLPRLDEATRAATVRPRRLLEIAGGALVAASALALLVLAADRNLAPGWGASDLASFAGGTRPGLILLVRLAAGVALAAAAAVLTDAWPRAAIAVAAAATVSFGSHAAARSPALVLVDLAHALAASAWVGGLVLVAYLAARGGGRALVLVRAFTPTATVAVAVVVLSGTVQVLALTALRAPADVLRLGASAYGRTLFVKLGLVGVMLAFGGWNGFVLGRRATTHAGEDRAFRAAVSTELALGLCVLLVTGVLTNSSPPDWAQADAYVPPPALRLTADADDLMLELVVSPVPVTPGVHRFDLLVREPAGGDHDITNVTLEFSKPDERALGEVTVELETESHGEHYGAEGAYLTKAGEWRVEVKVRRTNAYDTKAVLTVEVQSPEERT